MRPPSGELYADFHSSSGHGCCQPGYELDDSIWLGRARDKSPCGCDVTGRSRHWLSNVAYTNRKRRPGRNRKRRLAEGTARWLLGDLVRTLTIGALGRFDLLASLTVEDADKGADPYALATW